MPIASRSLTTEPSARIAILLGTVLAGIASVPRHAQAQAVTPPVGIPAQNTSQTTPTAAPTIKTTPPATSPAAATPKATAASAPASSWGSTISYGLQVDAGGTLDTARPNDGLNYGRLFDDKSDTLLLNQVQATIARPINSSAIGYDVGFTLQGLFGSDARYVHDLGEFDRVTSDRDQFSLLQADILVHTSWLTAGGLDWKIGQFVTPYGYETIDPSTNPFYSHSYIFDFGGPFLHTGVQAVWHESPTLDLYGQVDTGESTTFGVRSGDNNGEPAGLVGFGLNNLADGRLTVLSLAHLGPENALLSDPDADGQMRYESDTVVTWKFNKALTYVAELNFQHDDGFGADAYGASQYLSYSLTPTVTLNGRVEFFRDNAGFFVFAYPNNLDAENALAGRPNTSFTAGPATYSEYTLGLTWKPTVKPLALLAFRPEIRWDKSLSGTPLVANTSDTGYVTVAGDVILGF